MKMSHRKWRAGAILAVAAVGSSLFPGGTAGAIPPSPPNPSGGPLLFNGVTNQSRGAGSDTTYFQIVALADLYNGAPGCKVPSTAADGTDWSECNDDTASSVLTENFDHDEISNAAPFGVGSSAGLDQLCGNLVTTLPVNFARSSRIPTVAADCAGLTATAFARDGFSFVQWENNRRAWVTNASNQVLQGPPASGCLPGQASSAGATSLGFAGVAPGVTACNGFLSASANRRMSDKLIKAIWGTGGVTDWCHLNNSPADGAIPHATSTTSGVLAGDTNDPHDTNPAYFPLCATAMPIEKWAVNTSSGTYGFFQGFLGAAPNAHRTMPCTIATTATTTCPVANLGTPIQENDTNPILLNQGGVCNLPGGTAGGGANTRCPELTSSIIQRSLHWGSWGRFKAAPFTGGGAVFARIGLAGAPNTDFIAPTIGNVGQTVGCTSTTCYLYARELYNVVKTVDPTGPGLAAKAFTEWICRSAVIPTGNGTPHAVNDDTGKSFDVDLGKIFDRFWIARLGGQAGTFGACNTYTT